jgi:predicted AAA+ superfamily ATPase
MDMRRFLVPRLLVALSDTPVVLVNGARQVGKSTLVRSLIGDGHPAVYLTLDDASVLASAASDPAGFVSGLSDNVILDEVQRAPELFLAIKAAVDRDRRPGRFLLTGSANVLLLPKVADSLAGRIEILTLAPLSQGEIAGTTETFIDRLFADKLRIASRPSATRADLFNRIVTGGYPAAATRKDPERRRAWFGSYIRTVLERDVRDLGNIEGLVQMPRLLSLLATRSGQTLNFADISRHAGLPQTTLKRYMTLLETTFLLRYIPAWSNNLGQRLAKSPKLLLSDTGLIAYLLGLNERRLSQEPALAGPLVESFAALELSKQAEWSKTRPALFHFRTPVGREVDLVLEDDGGRVVGVEVKASATVNTSDFKGLHTLSETAGSKFQRGVVLYMGADMVPFGPRLHAIPLSALWLPQ